MKYITILILLAGCVSQPSRPRNKVYRQVVTKECVNGTVLYTDNICRPLQQPSPAMINQYTDSYEVAR